MADRAPNALASVGAGDGRDQTSQARHLRKLEKQRARCKGVRRVDYSPQPLVAEQLDRFLRARPGQPIQGVIDHLIARAALAIPEGHEAKLWGELPETGDSR